MCHWHVCSVKAEIKLVMTMMVPGQINRVPIIMMVQQLPGRTRKVLEISFLF